MALIELFFITTTTICFFFFLHKATSVDTCPSRCGAGPVIRFPFNLNYQLTQCGYPGFHLSCTNLSQTIITLPSSGDFTVQEIDYATQVIWINDPDYCLPKRFLQYFTLSDTPFDKKYSRIFTFLNCSGDLPDVSGLRLVSCLSGKNYTVAAIPTSQYDEYTSLIPSCVEISTVAIPVQWPPWTDLSGGTRLMWSEPDCSACENSGGTCELKRFSGLDVGCSNPPSNVLGLPRSAKYGIIIGVGIPGLLCFIGLTCYFCSRVRVYRQRHHPNTEFAISNPPQPAVVVTGLDGPTIESYPKTLLGESRRLPRPSDNTCPICLCEYQPKETLRTIPECDHYFHANCVDEWLRINATCPLCRKTPEESALVTHSPSSYSIV